VIQKERLAWGKPSANGFSTGRDLRTGTGSIGFNFADDVWNARIPSAASKAPLRSIESENVVEGPLSKKGSFSLDAERHSVDNGSVVNAVIFDPPAYSLPSTQWCPLPINAAFWLRRAFTIIRLVNYKHMQWQGRAHFFAVADPTRD
jgi:hypothetical protein